MSGRSRATAGAVFGCLFVFALCVASWAPAVDASPPLFRFAHVSDTHCMFPADLDKAQDWGGRVYSRSFDIFKGALTYLEDDVAPAFLVHTGDIVENGGWESGVDTMREVQEMTSGRSFRFFPVFGNHDNAAPKFEQVFGLDRYTFTYGSTRFIVLRCLNDFPVLTLRSLHIPKNVLYQLDDLLTAWPGNVVIAVHEPLRAHEDDESWARVANHGAVISLLERHGNVAMVLQGHTHAYFRARAGGIEYVTAPGLANVDKRPDASLGHGLFVYDVYKDRVEGRLHGAPSTDAAVAGAYVQSEVAHFSVPLPRRASVYGDLAEGLRPRALPLAVDRYDAEIEQAFDPIALYLFQGWTFRADPEDQGRELGWHDGEVDAASWETVKQGYLGNPWETYLARGYDGFGWYRIGFDVPGQLRGTRLEVTLGRIDDSDETYLNGSLIGTTGVLAPSNGTQDTAKVSRAYTRPSEALKYGAENVLAVRVYDRGGAGGLLGRPYIRIRRDRHPVAATTGQPSRAAVTPVDREGTGGHP